MSTLLKQLLTPEPPPINIPAAATRKTRFPIVILVDISGSTGSDPSGAGGANADIHRINNAIHKIVSMLRSPPQGTPLADNRDSIDLAILTYSNDVDVNLPWTPATNLPPMIAPFAPQAGTETGKAILFAISYALKQYVLLKNQNIKCGMPNIFHITDGAPTDMSPGSPVWMEVQANLARMSPNVEKKYVALKSFVTANGCDLNSGGMTLSDGRRVTGLQLMGELSNGADIFELSNTEDAFHDMVKLVTVLITHATQLANGQVPAGSEPPKFDSDNIITH
jgi:uncharacterized protein YegL